MFSFTQLTLEKCINFIIIIIQRGCNYVINIWFMTKLHTLLSMNFHLKQMNIQQKKISVSIHACNMKIIPKINNQFHNWGRHSYICPMFQQYKAWHSVLVLDSTCYFVWWSEIMHLCKKSIAMVTVIWIEHIIWLSDNCLHQAVLNLASLCITQQMPQISITFVAQDEFVTSRIVDDTNCELCCFYRTVMYVNVFVFHKSSLIIYMYDACTCLVDFQNVWN